jgi:hypothetical protein
MLRTTRGAGYLGKNYAVGLEISCPGGAYVWAPEIPSTGMSRNLGKGSKKIAGLARHAPSRSQHSAAQISLGALAPIDRPMTARKSRTHQRAS